MIDAEKVIGIICLILPFVAAFLGVVTGYVSRRKKNISDTLIEDMEKLTVSDRQIIGLVIDKLVDSRVGIPAIKETHEDGIINPYTRFPYIISDEMIDFLTSYITEYRDYPDARIVIEFAERFRIDINHAKEIERNYVIYNRNRIYRYIDKCIEANVSSKEIIAQVEEAFGLTSKNAERYVRRARMDHAMDQVEVLIGSGDNERE